MLAVDTGKRNGRAEKQKGPEVNYEKLSPRKEEERGY
jgi:hypothetical protein